MEEYLYGRDTLCLPGETIDRCYLQFTEQEIPIPLALPSLILCDCLVQHHATPLSIARMERILTSNPFYRQLGAHSCERIEDAPHFTRPSLRVYIARLRAQIAKGLKKGCSTLRAEEALRSETTDSNVVVHSISLPVEVLHRTNRLM